MSLYMLGTLRDMVEEVKTIKADVVEIKSNYTNTDGSFIEVAQEGSGADIIDSQNKINPLTN